MAGTLHVADGLWHALEVRTSSSQLHLFVDGALVASAHGSGHYVLFNLEPNRLVV